MQRTLNAAISIGDYGIDELITNEQQSKQPKQSKQHQHRNSTNELSLAERVELLRRGVDERVDNDHHEASGHQQRRDDDGERRVGRRRITYEVSTVLKHILMLAHIFPDACSMFHVNIYREQNRHLIIDNSFGCTCD